jgi:aldose sugar dehydrogenase
MARRFFELLVLPGLLMGAMASGCAPGNKPGAPTSEAPMPEAPVFANAEGPPRQGGVPPMPEQRERAQVAGVRVETVASNLEIPWAIGFAPDGRMFVTERPGRVVVIREGQEPQQYLDLGDVVHRGEGGLMGLALHPDFGATRHLFVMYTTRNGGNVINRVSRFTDRGETADDETVLVDNIPAAQLHNGGVLAFGPDGHLYIGTGDATRPPLAQDRESLAGKVLRVAADGGIPADNPFGDSPVYAYGFRNVTGLAWHPETGALWAASHGPSGEFPNLYHRDAVYVVRRGGNHGWPVVVGVPEQAGMEAPVLYYPEDAVPPGGALFYSGRLMPDLRHNFLMTALGATHLQRVVVRQPDRVETIERWWPEEYGRLRAIVEGPDGAIYFTTSNRDGRARRPYPGSDYIYRIVPAG